jgi:nickel transport protein
MNRLYLLIVLVWAMAIPCNALAHGTDYRLINKDKVIAAEFFYSDKTPMRYAQILVFSPENQKVEYQNGRTDQNGRFAFLPEIPGQWRMKVTDGMGHAVNATVTVNFTALKSKNGNTPLNSQHPEVSKGKMPFFSKASMAIKLILGLSILLNLFLGVSAWKRKSN